MKKVLYSTVFLIGLVMVLPQIGVAQSGKSALKGGLESTNFSSTPTYMDFKVVANALGLEVEDVVFLYYSGIGVFHGLDARPTLMVTDDGNCIDAIIDGGHVSPAWQGVYFHSNLVNQD